MALCNARMCLWGGVYAAQKPWHEGAGGWVRARGEVEVEMMSFQHALENEILTEKKIIPPLLC